MDQNYSYIFESSIGCHANTFTSHISIGFGRGDFTVSEEGSIHQTQYFNGKG
jgi:hypothetical protein